MSAATSSPVHPDRFADLHLHTAYSDGTFSPEELAQRARASHLSAIALTDHDTVEGCARMAVACAPLDLEFIPAAELTAQMNETELHLLGYFLDLNHAPLLEQMTRFQSVRQDRIREIVARINKLNIPLEAETVFAIANCRSPGRPHVGRALVQAGYCTSMDEAFERFLKKHRPAWVPKFKISAVEAIQLIHDASGLAVLAHPGLSHADDLISALREAGLDGLECYHSKHAPSTVDHYLRLAAREQLLVSGGSDCHGMNKGKPLIGSVKLPYSYVQSLKERVQERRAPAARGR